MFHCFSLLAAGAVFPGLLLAQSPLTTTYANNNGGSPGGSVYFDLTLNTGIAITQLDTNTSGLSGTLDLYTTPTTYSGNELNPGAWTLVATGTLTTPGGIGAPSAITFTSPFVLSPGTFGVQLAANGFAHSYTNGSGNNQIYSTTEITMNCGSAQNVQQSTAGPVFTPRVWNGSIYYQAGAGFGTHVPYGDGCGDSSRNFYETMTAASFDLANTSMTMVNAGNQYIVIPGGTFVPPTSNASVLPLTSTSETTVPLVSAFPAMSGPTTTLTVCSNGFVSTAPGNGTSGTPNVASWHNSTAERWGNWHNFNPNQSGTGSVKFEQIGGVASITWDGVVSSGQTTFPNTWQLQFDTSSGNVTFAWQSMSGLGQSHLVGYSAQGPARDAGSIDISTLVPQTFFTGTTDAEALTMVGGARPVIGTTASISTTEIPTGISLGSQIFSFTKLDPGIPLGALGLPSCFQYAGLDASVVLFPTGTTTTFSYPLPNDPGLAGVLFFSQSAMLSPTGISTSNGLELTIGTQ